MGASYQLINLLSSILFHGFSQLNSNVLFSGKAQSFIHPMKHDLHDVGASERKR